MKTISFFSLIILSSSLLMAQLNKSDSLYFGQTTPDDEAILFAPELISKVGSYEHDICFSPDGKELFFSVSKENWSDFTIFHSRWTGENWSDIDTAEFSKSYKNTEIIFAPNGKSVFFASSRAPGSEPWNFALFKADKSNTNWSLPEEIGIKSLQPSGNDGNWHPSVTNDSTVYFSSYKNGNYDIYYSKISAGTYSGFNNLGTVINSTSNDWYPWISPDEKTIVFSSTRAGGIGDSDLYVSFKNESNEWGEPINLGDKINTPDEEASPRITNDGKYFFFTRIKNWDGDFYWIKADFIDSLRVTSSVNVTNTIEDELNDIIVYPNPSSGIVNLSKKQFSQEITYCLFDQIGKVVISGKIENSTQSLELAEIPKGVYILRCEIEGQNYNTKILLY